MTDFIQPVILEGKLISHKRKENGVHATLRMPNNTYHHLVIVNTEVLIKFGTVLAEGIQPHVQVMAKPMSYHKPGFGNITSFEVIEISAQSDYQAVINQLVFMVKFCKQKVSSLKIEDKGLTNNENHDILFLTLE